MECELQESENEKLVMLFKFYQEAIRRSAKEVSSLQNEIGNVQRKSHEIDNHISNDLKEELAVKERALAEFNEFIQNTCPDLSEDSGSVRMPVEDYNAPPPFSNKLGAEIQTVKALLYEAENSFNRLQMTSEEYELEGVQKERTCIIMEGSELEERAEESSESEVKVLAPEEKLRVLVVYQPKVRSAVSVTPQKNDVEVADTSTQTLYFMYPPNCFATDYLRHTAHQAGTSSSSLVSAATTATCATQTYETAVKYKLRAKKPLIKLNPPEGADEVIIEERKASFISPRTETLASHLQSSMSELSIPRAKNWKEVDTRSLKQLAKRKIKELGYRKELESMSQREMEDVAKAIDISQTSQGTVGC